MLKRVLYAVVLLAALGCGVPAKPTPPPSLPASSSHGYLIRIAILDHNAERANRDVDCTISAYSGKTPILVTDPKTGREAPYRLTVTLPYPVEDTVHIYDPPAAADRIDYVCLFNGLKGESIDCEVSIAGSTQLAPLFSSQDFDLIEKTAGIGSCFGQINAREHL